MESHDDDLDQGRASPSDPLDPSGLVYDGWMKLLNEPTIGNAIRPKSWGPSCWRFLDCLAFSYPCTPSHEQQAEMAAFFHALKKVLPCYSCRTDFTKMMEDDPIERHLHSREALTRWLHGKHNNVNRKLGTETMSYPTYVSKFITAPDPRGRSGHGRLPRGQLLRGAQISDPGPGPQEGASWVTPVMIILISVGFFLGLVAFINSKTSAQRQMTQMRQMRQMRGRQ